MCYFTPSESFEGAPEFHFFAVPLSRAPDLAFAAWEKVVPLGQDVETFAWKPTQWSLEC